MRNSELILGLHATTTTGRWWCVRFDKSLATKVQWEKWKAFYTAAAAPRSYIDPKTTTQLRESGRQTPNPPTRPESGPERRVWVGAQESAIQHVSSVSKQKQTTADWSWSSRSQSLSYSHTHRGESRRKFSYYFFFLNLNNNHAISRIL